MSRHESKKELVGPWRLVHGAVWIIGLAILLGKGWIWPGILVLVGISMILEAVLAKMVPEAFEEQVPDQPLAQAVPPPAQVPSAPAAVEHRVAGLPSNCPRCGGPIRGHEVKWTGVQSADCPFCGANLPMDKH